jgi:hypothetical protein
MLHYTTTGESHRTLDLTVLVCAPLHFIQYVGHGGCVICLPFNALLLFKEEIEVVDFFSFAFSLLNKQVSWSVFFCIPPFHSPTQPMHRFSGVCYNVLHDGDPTKLGLP